jgi:conjugative relaxase-like TrwC/TraI family protein
MINVTIIHDGGYYLREKLGEYLGVLCVIFGSMASALRFAGEVSLEAARNVFAGRTPEGSKELVKRRQYSNIHGGCGKVRKPIIGWDVTFSVPKALSVHWMLQDSGRRAAMERLIVKAAEMVLAHFEEHYAFSRRGDGGKYLDRTKTMAVAFLHHSSRAGDCGLHVHAIVQNMALRPDGSIGSLVSKPLFDRQHELDAYFNKVLAQLLRQELGLHVIPREHGFGIPGISRDCELGFSKRHSSIKEYIAEHGPMTPKELAKVPLITRPPKQDEPLAISIDRWRREAADRFGLTRQAVESANRLHRKDTRPTPSAELVEQVALSTSDRHRALRETDIITAALEASIGSVVEARDVVQAASDALGDPKRFVEVASDPHDAARADEEPASPQRRRAHTGSRSHQKRHRPGNGRVLTPKWLARQSRRLFVAPDTIAMMRKLTRAVRGLSQDRRIVVPNRIVEATIGRYSSSRNAIVEELSHHATQLRRALRKRKTRPVDRARIREQSKQTFARLDAAKLRTLLQQRGQVIALADWTNDRRDLVLTAAVEAWRKAGFVVGGCSARHRDASRLEQRIGVPSCTFARLSKRMHPSLGFRAHFLGSQLVRASQGQTVADLPTLRLDPKTVLIVERADLLQLNELHGLIRDAKKHGNKLVLLTPPRTRDHYTTSLSRQWLNDIAFQPTSSPIEPERSHQVWEQHRQTHPEL